MGGPNKLYKRASGTTYYFTNSCDHDYVEAARQDASCGEDGSVTYRCTICGADYTEVIPATGEHIYEDDYDEECDECGDLREVPEKPQYEQGDINGDGSVNNRDLAAMQRYLNEWEIVVVEEMLDVNGDGSVNNRDLAALQRILNA